VAVAVVAIVVVTANSLKVRVLKEAQVLLVEAENQPSRKKVDLTKNALAVLIADQIAALVQKEVNIKNSIQAPYGN
jgi:ABC-type ATPase with predicted acetyltransferase domain